MQVTIQQTKSLLRNCDMQRDSSDRLHNVINEATGNEPDNICRSSPSMTYGHSNKLVAACRNPHVFCIIIEYLSGGSLRSYLHKQEAGSVSLEEFISTSLDIARGVQYLHSQGIIHRDLKSKNVLFTGDKCIKIIDFGIACEEINCDFLEEDGGTYHWMAPEVINHKLHNRKVDVYSFGKVLWKIFTRRVPYEDMIPVQAAFAVVHKSISALSCARRAWTNIDVDEITCEACGANLIFTMPPNATHIESLEKESDIGGILGRLEKYELEGAEIKAEIYE